jgi:hypothetical protein
MIAIGILGSTQRPRMAFLATLVLMALFTIIAGHGVVGLWHGLLIDERNRLSLSRLQMVLWTIVVLSGFLTATLWNISRGANAPRAIGVPKELLLLMGISATSLVGSALILSTKTAEPVDTGLSSPAADKKEEEWKELVQRLVDRGLVSKGDQPKVEQLVQQLVQQGLSPRIIEQLVQQGLPLRAIMVQGKIVIWQWPEDARMVDLSQGDEIGNAAHLDLGKVQMFYFTLVLVFTYVVSLVSQFSQTATITARVLAREPLIRAAGLAGIPRRNSVSG